MPRIALFVMLLLLAACGITGKKAEEQPVEEAPAPAGSERPELKTLQNAPVLRGGRMRLVWSDEFDADRLDPDVWLAETGDGRQYGNPPRGGGELQWYLPGNAELRDGLLFIETRREVMNGRSFTSARISTVDRLAFRYGRIEARIRLPAGRGLWPAFWLLPQGATYGEWPSSGEIDVLQAANLGASGGNDVSGTLHYGDVFPDSVYKGEKYTVPTSVSENFHTYALEWDVGEIRWYVDDVEYATQAAWFTPSAGFPAPFDRPFFILLNVAVGGNLPGPPDKSTVLPARMAVDYVRIYSGEH